MHCWQLGSTYSEGFLLQVGVGKLQDHREVYRLSTHASWPLVEIHLLENLQEKNLSVKMVTPRNKQTPHDSTKTVKLMTELRRQPKSPDSCLLVLITVQQLFLNVPAKDSLGANTKHTQGFRALSMKDAPEAWCQRELTQATEQGTRGLLLGPVLRTAAWYCKA